MKITTKKRLQRALKIGAVVLAALVLLVLLVGVGASCIKDRHKNRELITCAAEETQSLVNVSATLEGNTIPVSSTHKLTQWDTIDYENNKIVIQSMTKVFDGTEIWAIYTPSTGSEEAGYTVFRRNMEYNGIDGTIESICNVYPYIRYGYARSNSGTCQSFSSEGQTFFIKQNQYSTIDEWKAYLAALYAAGDPLTVSYQTAESYSVGLDYFYNTGKNEGYENGYKAGLEDGGLFHGVSISVRGKKTDGTFTDSMTASPKKLGDTYDLSKFATLFAPIDPMTILGFYFNITFGKAIPYYHYAFILSSMSPLVYTCTVVGEDGSRYPFSVFDCTTGSGKLFPVVDNMDTLKNLKIKAIEDFCVPCYTDGYKNFNGLSLKYEDTAYESGYAIGKQEGEDNAVFTFDNLKSGFFSILDAPFKTIKDALNFEFLGINISNLVLFLLTVIVVVIIIKKAVGK